MGTGSRTCVPVSGVPERRAVCRSGVPSPDAPAGEPLERGAAPLVSGRGGAAARQRSGAVAVPDHRGGRQDAAARAGGACGLAGRAACRPHPPAGHPASPPPVGRLLRTLDYSLKANRKERATGSAHPERDAQFRHIAEQRQIHQDAQLPIISVDHKKKELIGDFKNAGRDWYWKPEWSRSTTSPCSSARPQPCCRPPQGSGP